MLLLNGDEAVLQFSLDDVTLKVINNDFLPYQLKDWLKDTDFSTSESIKRSVHQFDVFKDFLLSRLLLFTRDNAKAILNSIAATQVNSINEKLKIIQTCRALSMTDNFWIKDESESINFGDVNLRNHRLGDVAFPIAIQGKVVSAASSVLRPELATSGMFAKTWYRGLNGIRLWKTDKTTDRVNTKAEVAVSNFLDNTNVKHVQYELEEHHGVLIASCDCIATDDVSIVSAQSVKTWLEHKKVVFHDWIESNYLEDFAKMCTIDYLIANTDRHEENWGFLIDNRTNEIIEMAPLFDHNQALIADYLKYEVDDLIYEPTNLTMFQSASEYYHKSNVVLHDLPTEASKKRLQKLLELKDLNAF
ncbi:hypothetical protein [Acetivibrio ethanolgignens]|uniref:PI3K/PI4K catalytic domain-containing protein n=1 Tax=Acetivibrio ethanolgignens TaxID=290052 RepID=A0A0V8QDT4_9FIRM|nr:hypothetical protein [Acetivibrio ethanolgignens]KSV58744.1 hypothetical protein ASU35_11820 [Acetivibrio ethanolgignens]